MLFRVESEGLRLTFDDSVRTYIPCGFAGDGQPPWRCSAAPAKQRSPGIYLSRFTPVVGCQQQGVEASSTQRAATASMRGTAASNIRVNGALGRCIMTLWGQLPLTALMSCR